MKKKIALFLIAVLCLTMFGGCGKKKDLEYILNKGEMIVGITLYEPMNYYDDNHVLIGFETEFTTAVCEKLGVKAKFQEIDWDQKETELKGKTIDCIWNGLTVTDARKNDMAFSIPYVSNRQVAIIRKADAEKYTDTASMKGAKMIAENGSAGETAITKDENMKGNDLIKASAQKDALFEVKAGTSDVAVVDYIMAKAVLREDNDYSDLMIVESIMLTPEEYAVGFRLEDTELVKKVDEIIKGLAEDGTLGQIAEKYNMTESLAIK